MLKDAGTTRTTTQILNKAQKAQEAVIHLKVDEEQSRVTTEGE